MVHPSAFRVPSEWEQSAPLEPFFFSGSFLTAFSGFCAGALGFGAASLSLSAFGGRPGASAVPALWVFPPLSSEPPAAFPVFPFLPGQAFPRWELPPVPRLSFPS